jgi:hypothetical protein
LQGLYWEHTLTLYLDNNIMVKGVRMEISGEKHTRIAQKLPAQESKD